MYKAATYILYFTWDGFGEVNVKKIVNKILFSNDFVYKCNASLHVTHFRRSKLFIKLTVKHIVAQDVKANILAVLSPFEKIFLTFCVILAACRIK